MITLEEEQQRNQQAIEDYQVEIQRLKELYEEKAKDFQHSINEQFQHKFLSLEEEITKIRTQQQILQSKNTV